MNRSLAWVGFWLLWPLATVAMVMVACGGPEAEIRANLSAGERVTFDRGRQLSTPCWSCHDLYGKQNKVGPYLAGLYGRPAGSAKFPGYSKAMKESGVVWNERSLREFLLNASGFIPGTNMVSGSQSPAEVRALVFYLKHVTRAVATEE